MTIVSVQKNTYTHTNGVMVRKRIRRLSGVGLKIMTGGMGQYMNFNVREVWI